MTRPRKAYRTVERKIRLPEHLVLRVEMTLMSEAQGRIPYGAWAGLLEPLLESYLEKFQEVSQVGPTTEGVGQ